MEIKMPSLSIFAALEIAIAPPPRIANGTERAENTDMAAETMDGVEGVKRYDGPSHADADQESGQRQC